MDRHGDGAPTSFKEYIILSLMDDKKSAGKTMKLLAGMTLLTLYGCASVPLSGRKQLILVSDVEEKKMGATEYEKVLKQTSPLAADDNRSRRVKKVGEKLAAHANRPDFQWEFNTIADDEIINAFCLPGGKVVVYTGILKIAETDDELATVMGHEIGHAIGRHGAERISQGIVMRTGGAVLLAALGKKDATTQKAVSEAYGTGAAVGILLPFSRKHEQEADYIGLILMAKAGYKPQAAVSFWEGMDRATPDKNDPLSKFLSTHPAHGKRIADIKGWLPEAEKHYQK